MKKTQIRIGSPCTLDWASMTPADRGRFCGACKKVVRDLSSMTERDARAMLRAPDASDLCVRFVYDRHGDVLFAHDGARLVPPSALLGRAKRAAAAAVAAVALSACSVPVPGLAADDPAPDHPDDGQLMGGAPALEDFDAGDPDAAAPDADASTPTTDADAAPDADVPPS